MYSFVLLINKNYFINQLIFKFMKKNFKRLAICLAVVAISVASYSVVTAGNKSPKQLQTVESEVTETKYPKCEGGCVFCCGNRETDGCNLSKC